jgi:tetratricopeptide (TPR) repeat protein
MFPRSVSSSWALEMARRPGSSGAPTDAQRRRLGGAPLAARRLVGLTALVMTLGVAMMASDAAAMQLSPSQKAEMKQHYDKATRAYDIQKYTEAVEEYQKAYEIGGDPAMLYNVAQSYRLNDQLPDALRFYRRYLQRSPNARNREDVERKIADLERTIAERRKASASSVQTAPPPLLVPPAPSGLPSGDKGASEEGLSGTTVTGIVVAAVGGAALIAAGITGLLAKDKSDQLSSDSQQGKMYDPSLQSDGKSLDKLTKIFAIAGGVALVAGGVLIAVGLPGGSGQHAANAQRGGEGALAVAPMVGAGILGAAALGRF